MKCAWQELINLLPIWMRNDVDKLGSKTLQELRLRVDGKPELVSNNGSVLLKRPVTRDDLLFCVNTASKYSPWASSTIAQGYITAVGGHRIGICGTVTVHNGVLTGMRDLSSLCIRVARDFDGISAMTANTAGSVLIIGKPGSGKTTFLRDMIRHRSNAGNGSVAVIDEKGEIFPKGSTISFDTGTSTDILSGCNKPQGIEIALRNLGPSVIAVDEITAEEDCNALLQAGWCGVNIFATLHAADMNDLYSRPSYKCIVDSKLFDSFIIMRKDKTWYEERITS